MPRLIINADDFGLTSGVNRAIAEGHRAGAISSATLMANSHAFAEAVTISRQLPGLSVGCHIVLIDGEPLCSGLPSLTDGGPRFRSSLRKFAVAAAQGRLSQNEIQREAEAQIRKIQSTGIALSHVDTHKHTHIFPHVLQPVLEAAKSCGIRAIRNPFEPFRIWPAGAIVRHARLWKRALQVALLHKYAARFQAMVRTHGMLTTAGTAGVIATGSLNQALMNATIETLPDGDWEFVCHPGYMDADLAAAGTRLLQSRDSELKTLISEETRQSLAKKRTQLISYAELV